MSLGNSAETDFTAGLTCAPGTEFCNGTSTRFVLWLIVSKVRCFELLVSNSVDNVANDMSFIAASRNVGQVWPGTTSCYQFIVPKILLVLSSLLAYLLAVGLEELDV